ncbi:MAG: DUF2199 domain-containing protein [Planctomycetes bacterium]|nr:DUF2199 domain-containing protein [Planctomycetota bacterium]
MSRRWQCGTCGEWHGDLPLCFGWDAPAQWSILSDAERRNSELADSACVIETANETSFYVRGHIEIPIRDYAEPFIWSVWASLSEMSFEHAMEHWNTEGREADEPYFGWLCSSLPVYPDTMFLKTGVQSMPVGLVPLITLEPTDHPLAVDQRSGVDIEQVQSWAERLLHD